MAVNDKAIKRKKGYNISKTTAFFELMRVTVNIKVSPIICKAKITDGVKNVDSLFNIINKQTFLFDNVNLLFCGYCFLMCVSDPQK